jgi:hypothetical protein
LTVVTCGETGCATAVLPGEFDLLSEFAAEPELAVDIPRQNIKQFTLFYELAAYTLGHLLGYKSHMHMYVNFIYVSLVIIFCSQKMKA